MSKIAAVAPLLAGLSAPAALGIGAALMGGSALLNRHGQRQHAKRQQEANNQWMSYQRDKTRRFEARDEANRLKAEQALNENLAQQDQESREAVIDAETDRLADEFTANLPETADAIRGSGQEAGTSQVFDSEMARRIGDATKEARDRMANMARATAYGGGSMYGMGMTDMLRNMNTATDIQALGNQRAGDTATLRRYQTVEPEILEYQQSPLVPILNAAGSFFLGGGPQNLASMLSNGAKAAGATAGNVTSAFTPSIGNSLVSSIRPKPRPNPMAPIGYVGMNPRGFA